MAAGYHFLDGQDVFLTWGISVTEGKVDALAVGKRKEGYEVNWPERDGTDVDLSVAFYEDVEINLRCVLQATSSLQLNQRIAAFVTAINLPGWRIWRVQDHNNAEYFVRYRDMVNWTSISRSFDSPGKTAIVSFTLVLTRTLNPTQDTGSITIFNPDGTVHTVLPPGSNFTLPNTGVTGTVSVTGVSVNQNTVTINATSNPAGQPLEYTLTGGKWQGSNVFSNVAPGTYTNVRARNINTGIEGVWPNAVVVTYSAPASGPAAPTEPITDNTNKRFGWTNSVGYTFVSHYEYTENGGTTVAPVSSNPQPISGAKAVGQVGVRVRAMNNLPASDWLFNLIAFTALPTYNTAIGPGQEAHGVTMQGETGTIFRFNGPSPGGTPTPLYMYIVQSGQIKAAVYHSPGWIGLPCSFEIGGNEYHFVFKDGMHTIS